jgi:hypothetical protein
MLSRLNTLILLLSSWLLVVLYMTSVQMADPDLWGRLSIAALYFQNGRFPYHDVFSYTAPHAKWIDHEWLTGFVFYGILAQWGETGFLAFKYLLILATFACLLWLHRSVYKASPLYAFLGLLALMAFYGFGYQATLRAQALTFFFFVAFIALLESVRLGKFKPNALGWLLPALVVWANCHGGFIVGVLLVALYGAGEAFTRRCWKPLVLYGAFALGGCALVGLLNPYGWEYWHFLFHAWTLNRSYIAEWSAVDFQSWRYLSVQILVSIIGVALLARGWFAVRKKENLKPLTTPVLAVLLLLGMCLRGIRFQTFLAYGLIAYYPLVFSPQFLQKVLPERLQAFGRLLLSPLRSMVPVLVAIGAVAGLCFMHSQKLLFQIPLGDELTQINTWGRYPIGAIRYLRSSPYAGNLLIRFAHGEFAYWCLFPRFRVSMDGRYEEVYTQQQFLENYRSLQKDRTLQAEEAFRLIQQSAADFILTEIRVPVTPLLLHSGDWEVLYRDPWFLVLGRKSSLHRFPPFGKSQALTLQRLTIGDFVTPEDLKRFKL